MSFAILVVLAVVALGFAGVVAAAGVTAVPRCDGVRLRTGPSTSYPTKAVIDRTDTVTVDGNVVGAHWSTLCGGEQYRGTSWARVTAIDGLSTQQKLGVASLYVAAGLVRDLTPHVTPTPTAKPTPSRAPPSAPPSAEPTDIPPATSVPTEGASLRPPASVSPAASGRPSPSRPAAVGGGPVGSSSDPGSIGQLVALALAVVSVALAATAYRERRRREQQRYMSKVPATRLDDVLH